MAVDDLRVAIVGYGLAGRVFHGPLVAATPGLRVSVIVTANPERQAAAHRDFPDVLVVSRPEELWARRELCDMAVVATPTGSHVTVATAAIDVGLPVVVDKPIAVTASDARDLVGRAAQLQVVLVPFFNRRWDSDHLTLSGLLAGNALGTVFRYESRFERWRPTRMEESWREQLAPEAGGGVLLDLGVHLVDQAMSLFGRVHHVYAEVLAHRGGADDDVFLALQHRSGVRSHLWASSLAAARGPRLRVLGSEAAYVIDHVDGQEDALRAGGRPGQPGFGEEPPERWGRLVRDEVSEPVPSVAGRWQHFYAEMRKCLRDDIPPPVAADDAIWGLEVLDAARESALTGTVERIATQ